MPESRLRHPDDVPTAPASVYHGRLAERDREARRALDSASAAHELDLTQRRLDTALALLYASREPAPVVAHPAPHRGPVARAILRSPLGGVARAVMRLIRRVLGR